MLRKNIGFNDSLNIERYVSRVKGIGGTVTIDEYEPDPQTPELANLLYFPYFHNVLQNKNNNNHADVT